MVFLYQMPPREASVDWVGGLVALCFMPIAVWRFFLTLFRPAGICRLFLCRLQLHSAIAGDVAGGNCRLRYRELCKVFFFALMSVLFCRLANLRKHPTPYRKRRVRPWCCGLGVWRTIVAVSWSVLCGQFIFVELCCDSLRWVRKYWVTFTGDHQEARCSSVVHWVCVAEERETILGEEMHVSSTSVAKWWVGRRYECLKFCYVNFIRFEAWEMWRNQINFVILMVVLVMVQYYVLLDSAWVPWFVSRAVEFH